MTEVGSFLNDIKGFGGYSTTATLWVFALLTWWKGLPAIIEGFSKFIDAWQNRAASIEERLQQSMNSTFERYDRLLADADKKHQECEARADDLANRMKLMDDELFIVKRDLTSARRQIAQYEARNPGIVELPVELPIRLPPNVAK